MVPKPIPSLELLRDLPLKITVPDDLRADVAAWLGRTSTEPPEAPDDQREYIVEGERLTLRAIAHIEGEAARLTQERFAAEDASTLRRRLVQEPKQRADERVQNMRQRVQNERSEWARRLDKQTRDVVEALRRELSRMELEPVPGTESSVMRASKAFRERFAHWTAEALDAWTAHLRILIEGQYIELIRPELDALESVLGTRLEPTMPVPTMPTYKVHIPDSTFQVSFEPPSLAASVFQPLKGGLDIIALLAGLVVVPIVGQLMDESPVIVRALVIGSMVMTALVGAFVSGMRTRKRLHAAALSTAQSDVARAVETSFVAQIDKFRAEVERHCSACTQEALRATMRVVDPVIERFVAEREASAVAMLANAQLKLDRIEDQLRSIRSVKYALEEQLLVDLRRSLHHA